MRRRSATTGLFVDDSLMLQETVGVLSNPERRASIHASLTAARSVALYRTSAANSKLEFVIVPSLFFEMIRLAMRSSGHG